MHRLLLILFLVLPWQAHAVPGDAWRADVDVLEQAYTQLHPGLYRYNTPEQMQANFAELRRALAARPDLAGSYLAYSLFAAKVRCGHTYPNFYNQSKTVRQALFEHDRRLPFLFRWLDGRMIVTRNQSSEPALRPGTEILAIDGIASGEILQHLMTIARADGGNDGKRISQLEVQGVDEYEAFDIYLPLLYPQIGHRMRLRLRASGESAPRELTVEGLTRAQRRERADAGESDPAAGWRLDFRDDGIAVLQTPNWALYDSDFDWKGFLRASFEQLQARKAKALVIDLRPNEGGVDVGDVLLAHLSATPVTMPGYERRTRYRRIPANLKPYLDTWDRRFDDWSEAATPLGDGFHRLMRDADDKPGYTIAPLAPRFAGKTYVLIGAVNSSATFEFARAVKYTGVATLVGQTTGGNRRGINGGAFYFLRLPNSGIELDLPLIGQFPLQDEPDAGIEPDIRVVATSADIAAGRDVEMQAILTDLGRTAP
ncbi:S41 family peptidase [Arenimonas sp.]|uniref:S41 family peptidase n=1 Tax=Arenimonas sp. TaxID=1872635 RepID=UPI0039E32E17